MKERMKSRGSILWMGSQEDVTSQRSQSREFSLNMNEINRSKVESVLSTAKQRVPKSSNRSTSSIEEK
jgi:hypothetical protein